MEIYMDNFQKIKATARSLSQRKLVYGHGTNDAWFTVKPTINGKQRKYKVYRTWEHMLERCYSASYQENHPTYKDCIVCPEWHLFSNFEAWAIEQDWQDKELDKDLLKQGNKTYCPEYCCFIPHELNTLLVGCDARRGAYPLGISWHKRDRVYTAQVSINGKSKHLGLFQTAQEAKDAYDKAKYAEIKRQAIMQSDQAIREGLLNWVIE